MTILEALGRTNVEYRIDRRGLARVVGMNDRTLRDEISKLRREGHYIIGDTSSKGGYYMGTAKEWDAFCDQQRRRAVSNFYKKSNEAEVMDGQMTIV